MLYFETIGSRLSLVLLSTALQFGALNCARHKKVKQKPSLKANKPIPVVTPKPTSTHTPSTNVSPCNAMMLPLVKIKPVPRNDRKKAKKKASLNAKKPTPAAKHKTRKPSAHKREKNIPPHNDKPTPLVKKTIPKNEKEKKIAKGKMVRRQSDFPAMQKQNLSSSLRSSSSSESESEVPSLSDNIDTTADDLSTEIEKVTRDRAKESKNKGGKKPVKKTTVESSLDD